MTATGRQSHMLRRAHLYMKGGLRTFAAHSMDVRSADKTAGCYLIGGFNLLPVGQARS
jgi:hypothetical protein